MLFGYRVLHRSVAELENTYNITVHTHQSTYLIVMKIIIIVA